MRSFFLALLPSVSGAVISGVHAGPKSIQLQPAGMTGDWARLVGQTFQGPPSAISMSGNIDIFGIAQESGSVQHARFDGSQWYGWEDLGGVLVDTPYLISSDQRRIDLFSRGKDNALYYNMYQAGQEGALSDWQALGGSLMSQPVSISRIAGTFDVFAQGLDKTLMYKPYTQQGWQEWQNLGGMIQYEPAVVAYDPETIHVYVVGKDDALYRKVYAQGQWSTDFENLGGILSSKITAVTLPTARIHIFAAGKDRSLQHRYMEAGKLGEWENLGGIIAEGMHPVAVALDQNRVQVYITSMDNVVMQREYDGIQWQPWENMGGKLDYSPAVVSLDGSAVGLFATGDQGNVMCSGAVAGAVAGRVTLVN